MAPPRSGLKGQDILVLLKLLLLKRRGELPRTRQADLAQALGISQAEIVHSLNRLRRSGFLSASREEVLPWARAALEFLLHGLRYLFPADFGAPARGVPTGIAAWQGKVPKGARLLLNDANQFVWPAPEGEMRANRSGRRVGRGSECWPPMT